MEYADADRLLGTLGQDDDWAFRFAPAGAEHTLDDETTLLVTE